MSRRRRPLPGLGAALVTAGLVVLLAVPALAAGSKATFTGAVAGRAKGGSADCYTVARSEGRARFMTFNAFRVGKVQYSMQTGFFGDANVSGRHDLVDDAPPGVTVLLVRSKNGRQWASRRGHVTLSDDGLRARLRATLRPTAPARGRDIEVVATIACEAVDDLPDPGASAAVTQPR